MFIPIIAPWKEQCFFKHTINLSQQGGNWPAYASPNRRTIAAALTVLPVQVFMCATKTHHANISRVNAKYVCKLYHCVFKQYSNPADSGQKQATIFLPWKQWFSAKGRQWRTVVSSTRAPVYWVDDSSSFSTLLSRFLNVILLRALLLFLSSPLPPHFLLS